MKKILIPTSGPNDWRNFLANPDKQWKRGRSAMAGALAWEASKGVPKEIAKVFDAKPSLLIAIPEHKVTLPGEKRETPIDIFALVRNGEQTIATAIEVKADEGFGPAVGEWLKEDTAERTSRLAAITTLLGVGAPPPEMRLQLLQRAAAAVQEAARFKTDAAGFIIQSFSKAHKGFQEFETFCSLFGLTAVRGKTLSHTLPDSRPLVLGWATGSPEFL